MTEVSKKMSIENSKMFLKSSLKKILRKFSEEFSVYPSF